MSDGCSGKPRYGAKSWDKERRFVARIEATPKGLDVRYVQIPAHCGQPFRRIADSVPVIADSF